MKHLNVITEYKSVPILAVSSALTGYISGTSALNIPTDAFTGVIISCIRQF